VGLTEGGMGKQEQEDGIREQRRNGNNMKNFFLSARKCRQISILVLSFSFVGGYYCENCHFRLFSILYMLVLLLLLLCCCTSCCWTLYIFSLSVPFHSVSLAPQQAFLFFRHSPPFCATSRAWRTSGFYGYHCCCLLWVLFLLS